MVPSGTEARAFSKFQMMKQNFGSVLKDVDNIEALQINSFISSGLQQTMDETMDEFRLCETNR